MPSGRKGSKQRTRFPIGTVIYKEFPGEGWFWGKVTSYYAEDGCYRVAYEDSDGEDIDEDDLAVYVEEAKKKKKEQRTSAQKKERTSAKSKKATPKFSVGTAVYKEFPGHGWFWGNVTSYDAEEGCYRVAYEDSDEEEIDEGDLAVFVEAGENEQRAREGRKERLKEDKKEDAGDLGDSSGMRLEKFKEINEGKWNGKFEELKRFKQVHGHCNIPLKFNIPLGIWVSNQRSKYRKRELSEERVEKLKSIGFEWNHSFNVSEGKQAAPSVDQGNGCFDKKSPPVAQLPEATGLTTSPSESKTDERNAAPRTSGTKHARSPEEDLDGKKISCKSDRELELEKKIKRYKNHIKAESAAHTEELIQKDRTIAEKDQTIEYLRAELTKRQQSIRILNRELQGQKEQIDRLEETIGSKNKIIDLQRQHMDEFDQESGDDEGMDM
jgi:hypothetical protein